MENIIIAGRKVNGVWNSAILTKGELKQVSTEDLAVFAGITIAALTGSIDDDVPVAITIAIGRQEQPS